MLPQIEADPGAQGRSADHDGKEKEREFPTGESEEQHGQMIRAPTEAVKLSPAPVLRSDRRGARTW